MRASGPASTTTTSTTTPTIDAGPALEGFVGADEKPGELLLVVVCVDGEVVDERVGLAKQRAVLRTGLSQVGTGAASAQSWNAR